MEKSESGASLKLLATARLVPGAVATISGILTASDDGSWVTIAVEGKDGILAIGDASFQARLFDNVPCYVGGEYAYRDRVRMEVVIDVGEGKVPFIAEVRSCELIRGSEKYVF